MKRKLVVRPNHQREYARMESPGLFSRIFSLIQNKMQEMYRK